MTSSVDHETDQLDDEYYEQDEDDLKDFIVDYDEDDESVKHKHHRQKELEDEIEGEEEEEEEEEVEVEQVEEEEEEEAPVGQQEILSLREKLKEKIRKKNAAMAAGACKPSCSSSTNQTVPPAVKDRFGTFFGPSKPVLARRVIEEGCSSMMKELQNNGSSRKDVNIVSKAQLGAAENVQKPKLVSQEKRKVDMLRENRDYSALFSADADTEPLAKEQPDNKPTIVPKSETQVRGPVSASGKSRVSTSQPARLVPKDHRLKAPVQRKAGSLGKGPHDADRKRMIAACRNGSTLPSKMTKPAGLQQSSSNGKKLQASVQSKRPQASIPGQRQPLPQGQRLPQQMQIRRPQPQINGRQQPLQGRRPDPPAQAQRSGQNGSAELHARLKSVPKPLIRPSSKLKASRPMENRAVKRNSDDGEMENISRMIRGIFKYYPETLEGDTDEDDSDMEADFASIEKEERRSAFLARKEDEEQLRLIQEEERREREKKRRKLAQKQ